MTIGGRAQPLAVTSQRLVALLAIHGAPLPRQHVAFTMWLDKPEARALANLRSVLWRMRQAGVDVVTEGRDVLGLCGGIEVDYQTARAEALRLVAGEPIVPEAWHHFVEQDLLPGWYEDWVIVERERFRQLRLHVLESVSARLVDDRRIAEAIDLALVVIRTDPLRESAHRVLIEAHLANGNLADAQITYDAYRDRLLLELGVPPSPRLVTLLADGLRPERSVSPEGSPLDVGTHL